MIKTLLVLFSAIQGWCEGLEITHFNVPRFVDRKEDAVLECAFGLQAREQLQSVKWYHIDHLGSMREFYSFQPSRNPPAKTYKLPGVFVAMRHSNIRRVLLKRVSLNTTGTYRCEVTAKSNPGFDSKNLQANMVVLELPKSDPVISGGLRQYHIGERLELNCTSPRSYPPTSLKWFINGQEHESEEEFPLKHGSKNGLYRSRIGLNITVHMNLFKYGKIRIECVGEIKDGIIQGMSQGSSHQIETIRLPEALKRERSEVFVVPLVSSSPSQKSKIFCLVIAVMISLRPNWTNLLNL